MNTTRTILALMVSLWAFPMLAIGQNAAPSSSEVNVDDMSLSDLRRAVYRAEEDFYSVYNKLNDEKEYDVRCFYEKTTGTNIKNHVCRARFVTAAFERHARRNRNNLSRVANQSADPVIAEKTAKYEQKMETLVAESPELQAALEKYNTLRAQFVARRDGSDNN